MPAPDPTIMTNNIKLALLSEIDPATGHPLYCKKTVDNNGNITYHDFEVMDGMLGMITHISQGICTTWTAWQATQTVVAGVNPTSMTTIPLPGNLP